MAEVLSLMALTFMDMLSPAARCVTFRMVCYPGEEDTKYFNGVLDDIYAGPTVK